jgi:hypothetical protein
LNSLLERAAEIDGSLSVFCGKLQSRQPRFHLSFLKPAADEIKILPQTRAFLQLSAANSIISVNCASGDNTIGVRGYRRTLNEIGDGVSRSAHEFR